MKIQWELMLTVALIGILQTSKLVAEDTVRITNGEWIPYYGESLPDYGMSSKIVTEAFELVGIDVEYEFMPWARSHLMAKEGKFDGAIGWHDSPENREDFLISEAIATTTFVFFHLKKASFDWSTLDDLKKKRFGMTRGYEYPADFLQLMHKKKAHAEWVNRDELGFKMLLLERTDAFPQDLVVGYTLLASVFSPEEFSKVTHHKKPLLTADLHLLFPSKSERSERLLQLFNQGLEQLKASGRYDEIYYLEMDTVSKSSVN